MESRAKTKRGDMSDPRTYVFITTSFEGFHCWPDAPDEVAFLRDRHRHIFHVRLEAEVGHDDRDIEFILLKRAVDEEIKRVLSSNDPKRRSWSCESWARHLLEEFDATFVEVSEDGENGAIIKY